MKRKILPILFFSLLLFALISLSASAETEPQTSPYGLYVGGVAVTLENAADVFGDGCATYDVEKNILTLNGFNKTGVSTINFEGSLVDFSVYAEKDTSIRITGKGNVFANTVCAVGGNIMVEAAEASFQGEGFSFLLCALNAESGKNGDILIYDSKLQILGFKKINLYGFCAKNVIFQKSDFKMSLADVGEYFSSSILCALSELQALDSHFLFETQFPYATSLFQGGKIAFDGCDLSVSGAEYVFHSLARENKDGSLTLLSSSVTVKDSSNFAESVCVDIEDSTVAAQLYYGGIRVVQSPGTVALKVLNSSVDFSCLSFEKLEKRLKEVWNAMDVASKTQYRNDYDYYVSYTKEKTYPARFAQGYGIAASGGDVSFEKSTFTCEGFRTALYLQYAVTLALGEGVTLDLKAAEAAFIMASSYENALKLPSRVRTRFSSIKQMPADPALTDDCPHLFGAAKKKLILDESVESTDLLDLLSGEASHIRIRTAPFAPLWLSLTIIGALTALILGAGVLYILKVSPTRERASKKQK